VCIVYVPDARVSLSLSVCLSACEFVRIRISYVPNSHVFCVCGYVSVCVKVYYTSLIHTYVRVCVCMYVCAYTYISRP
jgi:hypothetical protein